ncbi:hypothetical protein [Neoroseomonas soli]|uniref:UrcA family protein n=1 Tax=Neoroseomonas soli TaxID=1081025 RepID=A0A9X9WYB6_9PROT|nr:hypothetical protein [Neoroseomonas soli]MBR0672145.1 hypothetical protein [Neoroseomonas soli]
MCRNILGAALLVIAAAGPAAAQTSPPATAVTPEGLDRGLVNLGLMAGHAYQCLPEGERPAAQQAVLAFNSILVAQMGANAAFRFSSSFGAGSSHDVDRSFCERSLVDWRKLLQDHNLNR